MYDYMRSSACPFDELINASNLSAFGDVKDLNTFVNYLNNDHSGIRYWGAMGLLFLGDRAVPAIKDLKNALKDESASVVTLAAEALYNLGMRDEAENALLNVLKSQNKYACGNALNTIDNLEMESSPELVEGVVNMIKNTEMSRENFWIYLAVAKWLFKKWELNEDDYNIEWYY